MFSWDFKLKSAYGAAYQTTNWGIEQGTVTADGVSYRVKKHGFASGFWTLETREGVYASAQKCNPLTRSFDVEAPEFKFELKAQSPFTRAFNLLRRDKVIAKIRPNHPFTRSSLITANPKELSITTLAFSFWLVTLMWKRNRRNNN